MSLLRIHHSCFSLKDIQAFKEKKEKITKVGCKDLGVAKEYTLGLQEIKRGRERRLRRLTSGWISKEAFLSCLGIQALSRPCDVILGL